MVTVGVPVYNGQRYLARALDSLLAQTFDDFEIVLCDNASEDRTAEICAAYAARDPRIRFHRNPQNLGLVRNFNRTFELAKGKYFKWASHDDWHARESLELTVKALEANPDAALCGTGVSIVDEDGIEYDRWTPPGDLRLPEPHQRLRRLLWTLAATRMRCSACCAPARERRLMAAEVNHYGRNLAVRSRHRMRSSSLSDGAR